MRKGLLGFIMVLGFMGCQLNDEINKNQLNGNSSLSVFSAPYAYSNLTEGIYIGGSQVYSVTNQAINQLLPGMVFRIRLDKADPNDNTKTLWYLYGFLNIRAISESGITVDYILYDNEGKVTVNKQNITIALGQNISLNDDTIPDLAYIAADSPGFEGAYYLQFLSSKAKLTRSLFMLMPDEYPGGEPPSGLIAVNPSGSLVVNLICSNTEGTGPYTLKVPAGSVPALKTADFVVNETDGKIYRVVSVSAAGDLLSIKASEVEQSSPYELMFMKFKGTVEQILAKFSPDSETRAKALTLNLFSYSYDNYIINNASFKLRLRNNTRIDLILDGNAEVGWFWAGGWVEIKVQLTGNFSLEAQMLLKKNWNAEQLLANPSQLFWLGPVPFQISMPVYIGVDATVQAIGTFKTGFNIVAGAGARFGAQIGWPTKAFFTPINYCEIVSTPFEAEFEGSVTVSPYLSIRPTLSVAWILHAGVDVRAYIEGVIAGKVTFKPGMMTGSVSLDLNVGLKGIGFVAIGVDWLGLYQRWNLGTLFDWKHNLYHWGWDVTQQPPASLTAPQNFNTTENPDGSVAMTWSPVNLSAGYYIYKKTNNVLIDRYFTTQVSHLDKIKLTNGVDYSYTVSAINGVVESPQSTVKIVNISPVDQPGGFGLTSNPSGSIGVNWSPVTGALQYKILRTATGGIAPKTIYTSATSIIDTDLKTNITYSYSVKAMNYAGEGVSTAVISTNAPLPAAPGGFTVKARTSTVIKYGWNMTPGAISYHLVRTDLGTGQKIEFFTITNYFEDFSIEYDKTYSYKVYAKNYIGNSPYSASNVIKTGNTDDPFVNITSPTYNQAYLVYPGAGWLLSLNIIGKATTGGILPVSGIYYKVDGSAYQSYNPLGSTNLNLTYPTLISEGNHNLYIYCVDSANKVSYTNIIPFSSGRIIYVTNFGTAGTGNGQFNNPIALAKDTSGKLYVLDAWNYRVQKFLTNGTFVYKFGQNGSADGQFGGAGNVPMDITVTLYDKICVADTQNHRVQAFLSSDGSFYSKHGVYGLTTNAFDFSWDYSITSLDGGEYTFFMVLRVNPYNSIAQIKKINTYGTFSYQWGSYGSGAGQFMENSSIEYNSGYVYITDHINNRIEKFSTNGTYVASWGTAGSGNAQFNYPGKVSFDATYIYIADTQNNRIQILNKTTGAYYYKFGSIGSGPGQFNGPNDVVVDGSFIYVLDTYNNRIQVFKKSF